MTTTRLLEVGEELTGPRRVVTAERLRWYGDGMLTAASDVPTQVGANIHTDEAYAREQGLPTVIADGMLSTNWISSLLLAEFGEDYLLTGELRTKFIRPTLVDVSVGTRAKVRRRTDLGGGRIRYELEVWAEDADGTRLTDGDATVEVGARKDLDG
jgi:3-hydroxybutyryl-CoA dehydratase